MNSYTPKAAQCKPIAPHTPEAKEFIRSLRLLANWYEAHPEISVLPHPYLFKTLWPSEFKDPKTILAAVAKAGGKVAKNYTETEIQVEVRFGSILLRYDAPREKVCERVKVGEKIIPAKVVPAREEMFIPEKVEEIFEWKCPESLLAGAK